MVYLVTVLYVKCISVVIIIIKPLLHMLYLACIKHVLTFSHVLTTNHILTSTTGLDNLNYTGGAFDLYGFHVTSSNGVLCPCMMSYMHFW